MVCAPVGTRVVRLIQAGSGGSRNLAVIRRPDARAPLGRHKNREHRPAVARVAVTLAVDALGIVLAALGMINPLFAAFIHVSSELTFILNSTRLLPRFSRQPHLGN